MGKGAITSGEVEYGQLSADAGHAEIHGKARSGEMIVRASRDEGKTWNVGYHVRQTPLHGVLLHCHD